ncbi:MAG: signal peptidase I [Myxococcota bacterium]
MSRGGSPTGGKGARGRDVEERGSFAARAWEQIWPLAAAVLVALGIRAVIIESYYVPSGSMFPSLLIGDHVFVNKFTYGARIPFTEEQLPALVEPRRGQIAVFALGRRGPGAICPLDQCPDYPAEGFVKRLVGLPGDTIEFRNGDLFLNGERVEREDTGRIFEGDHGRHYRVYREHLGDCVHEILDDPRQAPTRVTPIEVPEGRYYFLGDNRDNSNDSRFWGTVHRRDLKGPVIINYWSWNNRESWIAMLNPFTWIRLLWSEMYWDRIGLTYDCWEGDGG